MKRIKILITLTLFALLAINVGISIDENGKNEFNLFELSIAQADEGEGSSTAGQKKCGKDTCTNPIGGVTYYGHYWHCKTVKEVSTCDANDCYEACDALGA